MNNIKLLILADAILYSCIFGTAIYFIDRPKIAIGLFAFGIAGIIAETFALYTLTRKS